MALLPPNYYFSRSALGHFGNSSGCPHCTLTNRSLFQHLCHLSPPHPQSARGNPFLSLPFSSECYFPSALNSPLIFFPLLSCVLFSTAVTSETSPLCLLSVVEDRGGFHLLPNSLHFSLLSTHVIQLGLMPVVAIDPDNPAQTVSFFRFSLK